MTLTGVTLQKVTSTNRAQVEALRVSASQNAFVDGVASSLAEAAANPACNPWCRAVYSDDTPVGFLMLAVAVPPNSDVIPWRHYLWRMLIDVRYQGLGYGRAALDLLTELPTDPTRR